MTGSGGVEARGLKKGLRHNLGSILQLQQPHIGKYKTTTVFPAQGMAHQIH
jgi:hypothetical protein